MVVRNVDFYVFRQMLWLLLTMYCSKKLMLQVIVLTMNEAVCRKLETMDNKNNKVVVVVATVYKAL